MNNAEQLAVELFIDDSKADAVLDSQKAKFEQFQKSVENFKPKLFANADKAAFEKSLLPTDSKGIGLDALSASAARLKTEIVTLRSDIASLNASAAASKAANSIFNKYEDEAAQLNRQLALTELKLKEIEGIRAKSPTNASAASPTNLKLNSFQKTNLLYQANDVATMAALGANPTQILASQGGQIAQTFSADQIAAFTAKYASLLPVLAAGSAAIYATWKITGDVRAEADRRLSVEEKLAVLYGKQISQGREILENYRKQGIEAQRNFEFNKFLQANNNLDSLESLKSRQKTLETLGTVNGVSSDKSIAEEGKRQLEEANRIRDLVRELEERNRNLIGGQAERAFRIQAEGQARQMEMDRETAARKIEAQEKFNRSVEAGKAKVSELGKTYQSVFDGIFARSNSDNSFARLFTDAEKSMRSLRDQTKGLSSDLIKTAVEMERAINARNLFSTRLDNNLNASDLNAQAANFRNPFDANKVQKQQDEFINRFLFNNPNYLFLQGKKELDDAARADILKRGNFDSLEKRRNDDLERQRRVIFGDVKTADDQAIADKKFINLTNGVNPLELSQSLREQAARSRENEADRLIKAESEAAKQREKALTLQEEIRDELKKLNDLAEKDGIKGVENLIRIVDETDGRVRIGKTPSQKDTAQSMK
jgi:hypothetical protein